MSSTIPPSAIESADRGEAFEKAHSQPLKEKRVRSVSLVDAQSLLEPPLTFWRKIKRFGSINVWQI